MYLGAQYRMEPVPGCVICIILLRPGVLGIQERADDALEHDCSPCGAQVLSTWEPYHHSNLQTTSQTRGSAFSGGQLPGPRRPGSAPLCPSAALQCVCTSRAPLFSKAKNPATLLGPQPNALRACLSTPVPQPHTHVLNLDPGPLLDPEARASTPAASSGTWRHCPFPLQTGRWVKATARPPGKF